MTKHRKHPPDSYYILSLGCPKNTVDSEGMAVLLEQAGYTATANPEEAHVLIVNTCGFLQAAKEESIAYLQSLGAHKRPDQILIAAGCLVERAPDEVQDRVPQVDGLLGTLRWADILPLVRRVQQAGREADGVVRFLGPPRAPYPTARAPRVGPTAYLKIADGCNAACAFCTIPSFKGKLRSRPFAQVVEESQHLVQGGARELVLVAQDTTDYGRDWGEPDALPRLMHAIVRRNPDLVWLRLMYAYPGHVTDRLMEVMASHPQIVHYLDIPLQHGDPRTLRRMRRPSNVDMVVRMVERLRQAMPDVALRTTFIVGYPGETEEEFANLLAFVESMRFDKVGAFTFSPEPGTPAAALPDQVPEEVKEERWHRLMALQQAISLERNQAQVGRVLDVLAEQVITRDEAAEFLEEPPPGDLFTLARSYREAPDIDGYVIVPGPLEVGQFHQVKVVHAWPYDLLARPVGDEE
ncbi:MAG: 30S ribosomal protein S12 methylthiotransferase RimO [Chloroflexi bacterium]|nr:30S ribosomal protein S12 methylthiotransferase RimO [Chloroflexota bacterium]